MVNIIFLAAGIGSRAYPLTEKLPKCLLKIGKETIIDHSFNVIGSTFSKYIVAGFEYQKIMKKMENKCNIIINPFFKKTNSIASLWFAKNILCDDVIIINADIYFTTDIFSEILNFKEHSFVVCDSSRNFNDSDYKITVKKNRILNMGKTIDANLYCAEYAGITKLCKKDALLLSDKIDCMVKNGEYDTWYETALVRLINEKKLNLSFLDISNYKWTEIDTIQDLKLARKIHFSKKG